MECKYSVKQFLNELYGVLFHFNPKPKKNHSCYQEARLVSDTPQYRVYECGLCGVTWAVKNYFRGPNLERHFNNNR